MNAAELTGFTGFGNDDGSAGGAADDSAESPTTDPVSGQILGFWPITFARQIGVMCKFTYLCTSAVIWKKKLT